MELLPPSPSRPMPGPPQKPGPSLAGASSAAQQAVSPFSAVSGSDEIGNGHPSSLTAPLLPTAFAGHPRSDAAASEERAGQADRKAGTADGILQLTSDTVSSRTLSNAGCSM